MKMIVDSYAHLGSSEISKINIERLQFRARFQNVMVPCSKFVWITNSNDQ